jgi:hypothetical protein
MFARGKTDRVEGTAKVVRLHASRRAERVDMILAATLLVALVFGWVVRLVPMETWPRGDYLYTIALRHT